MTTLVMFIIAWCLAVGAGIVVIAALLSHTWTSVVDELKDQLKASHDRELATQFNLDKWRTKARVLQGKYEPIGSKVDRWWENNDE